jgi:hypothetical protein
VSESIEKWRGVEAGPLIAALLDEVAERLYKMQTENFKNIEKLLAKPKGYIYPIKITVAKLEIIDFLKEPPHTQLFAVTIFNDGPDEVYPSVNIHQRTTPIKPNENVRFEFTAPKIEKIFLDVDDGKTANIRGFGVY